MRILQVHNFYAQYGGECRVVESERALLEEAGHQVIPFYRYSSSIEQASFINKGAALTRIAFNPSIKAEIETLCASQRPDVAHVHNVFPLISPSLYYYLGRINIPIVQTVHNYRFVCPNGLLFTNGKVCEDCLTAGTFLPAVRKGCFRASRTLSLLYATAVWVMRRMLPNITRFVAISQFIRNKLIQGGIPAAKVRVCGNFIDGTTADGKTLPKRDYLLYLGRLSVEKGVLPLLDALSRSPQTPCVIAGTGPLLGQVKERLATAALAHVSYAGFVGGEEKTRLIRGAQAMIAPSVWYENFPMSVVESLSLGTPVIGSRMGGLPELIEDGVTGMLVPQGDAGELAQAFLRMTENPAIAARLGQNAQSMAAERFSSHRHLTELVAIYQEAIAAMKNSSPFVCKRT